MDLFLSLLFQFTSPKLNSILSILIISSTLPLLCTLWNYFYSEALHNKPSRRRTTPYQLSVNCFLIRLETKWRVCYPVLMHHAMQVPFKIVLWEDICGMLALAVGWTDTLTSLSVSEHCCRIVGYLGLHLQHVVTENTNERIATQDRRIRCRMEIITTLLEHSSREAEADSASAGSQINLDIRNSTVYYSVEHNSPLAPILKQMNRVQNFLFQSINMGLRANILILPRLREVHYLPLDSATISIQSLPINLTILSIPRQNIVNTTLNSGWLTY
jgi:hypothetical protein